MASIRKRGGRYQARIHRRGFPTLAKTFLTQRDALQWARKAEVALEQVSAGRTLRRITVREMVERYASEVTPTKKGARTERLRLNAWARSKLGPMLVDEVRPSTLAEWRDRRLADGLAGSTVRNDLNTLSAVYGHAASEWGYERLENPTARLRRPRLNPGRTRRVAEDELAALKTHTDSETLPDIIDIAVETGMRLSEITNLQWRNIDLAMRTAILPDSKNGHRRVVPLSPTATNTLSTRKHGGIRKPDDRVFQVTPHAVTTAFRRAALRICRESKGRIGVNLRFHDLRHEAVSRLFERGLNVTEVAAISGHRSLQMLMRYSHPSASRIAKKLEL
jgi:integrase